jgi:hypothetical protein
VKGRAFSGSEDSFRVRMRAQEVGVESEEFSRVKAVMLS